MRITEFLQNELEHTTNPLEEYVINYYLKEKQDCDYIDTHMCDVLEHGCGSGVMTELIYYEDTIAFCEKYECQIEELADNIDSFSGVLISILDAHDITSIKELKNYLAWFAFEETTRMLFEQYEEYRKECETS